MTHLAAYLMELQEEGSVKEEVKVTHLVAHLVELQEEGSIKEEVKVTHLVAQPAALATSMEGTLPLVEKQVFHQYTSQ